MQFFIPGAPTDAEAESVYAGVSKFIGAKGVAPRKDRIQSLTWRHNDHQHYPTVGGILDSRMGGEKVIAIIAMGSDYAICTQNNGVLTGEPIKLPARDCIDIRKFSDRSA